jgi:alkylation response protein AidB-like acyl-CoA dehydrogenase
MSESEVDRAELRAMARDMLSDVSASADVRAVAESESRYDPALWRQFSEVGWAGMEAAEAHGGGSASFGDAAVVLVELGRHLTVSPLASSMVLGLGALLLAGSPEQQAEWVPGIADGSARVTAALVADNSTTAVHADGDAVTVTGRWDFVPDADLADHIVLQAPAQDGDLLLVVPAGVAGLEVTPTPMMDLTRRMCVVSAQNLHVPASSVLRAGGPRAAQALADRAALATACDSLGVAERALAMSVDYAKQRVQFGRQIGSFQAIKHLCADMLIAVETARVAVNTALDAYDADPYDCALAVSMAKAHAGDAAAQVTQETVTLHGGIGYTWEHDCHLMLKRAKLNQALDGSTRFHRRRTADLVLTAS